MSLKYKLLSLGALLHKYFQDMLGFDSALICLVLTIRRCFHIQRTEEKYKSIVIKTAGYRHCFYRGFTHRSPKFTHMGGCFYKKLFEVTDLT